ncbi:efflux RND transporter periplasmic adaptor subunit [Catenovulum sp. SX2]|uniref:efflux RND transporter periplasmic adaptor subunit n=1 Tax=Catenovulum sp. SX2 TaxID=3398614 RepID=UPI003F827133
MASIFSRPFLFGLTLGGLAAFLLASIVMQTTSESHSDMVQTSSAETSTEKKPLYWVAPMDANYRRDKPGKSPMGMDLVPVYEENANNQFGEGVVSISPEVVNNLAVKTTQANLDVLTLPITASAVVEYDQNSIVHVHPRVEGWLDKLYVKAQGEPVEKGQPLYTLYSPQLVNAQEEYLIALKRGQNPLIKAARERLLALQLPKELIEKLNNTQTVQAYITFSAPQTGVVNQLPIREGFYVQPGTTIMSIATLDKVWVEAQFSAKQSPLVKSNLAINFVADALPQQQFSGVVDYIYPQVDEKTRLVRARIVLDNAKHQLKAGMYGKVEAQIRREQTQILLPLQAVIQTGKQNRVVLELAKGLFKSVEVELGHQSNQFVEVLSGVMAGDKVVTSAQFLLDSESSKSSDFLRMQPNEIDHTAYTMPAEQEAVQQAVQSATVMGVINSIDAQSRILNISRGAIEKWNRPPATIDFIAADSIDLSQFNAGMSVHFTFDIHDDFIITSIMQMDVMQHGGH